MLRQTRLMSMGFKEKERCAETDVNGVDPNRRTRSVFELS
jgi:hypothetical protein